MKTICVLPGDGIGPEVVSCAIRILEKVTDELELVHAEMGLGAYRRTGEFLPDDTLRAMMDSDSCLFGAATSLPGEGYDSPVLRFRKELDLYANIRPVRDIAGLTGKDVDLVIVRENSEGLYTGDEREDDGCVTTHRRVSRRACDRIVQAAIAYARGHARKHLCCVHKANVLRKSDGLFLSTFHENMESCGGGLTYSDRLVDSAAARLVTAPESYDVVVTLNLYGDILSDVAAGVVGGLGFAPSGNIGPVHSVFEPAHGSAADIAGRGIANPTAAILSAAMMLRHVGLLDESERIERAVTMTYRKGKGTLDVGGEHGSESFTSEIVDGL